MTFARLRLAAAGGPFAPGDRFVLRDAGRDATVAGGTVLAVDAATVRRTADDLARRLAALSRPEVTRPGHLAAAVLCELGGAAPTADVLALTGQEQPLGTRRIGATVVGVPALRAARRGLLARLAAEGAAPVRPHGEVEELAAAGLVARGLVHRRDGELHPPGTHPDAPRRAAVQALEAAVADGRLAPLFTIGEAVGVTGLAHRELRDLVRAGQVVEVPPFVTTRPTYLGLAAAVAAQVDAAPATAAELKGVLGLSRRYAIPLLEALDRDGVTSRLGDRRVRGARAPGPA